MSELAGPGNDDEVLKTPSSADASSDNAVAEDSGIVQETEFLTIAILSAILAILLVAIVATCACLVYLRHRRRCNDKNEKKTHKQE